MSDSIKLYIGRNPRSVVASGNGFNLLFERYRMSPGTLLQQQSKTPTVVIRHITNEELHEDNRYFQVTNCIFNGILGLIAINGGVFLGVISGAQNVGFPRWKMTVNGVEPSESIFKVLDVDFYSLDSNVYDLFLLERSEQNHEKLSHEHPCASLKKLYSDGSFYFSKDFDLSNIVKNHGLPHNLEYTIDNQDIAFIWNSSLTTELITWRSRIPLAEKQYFDSSGILTFVIRGFCKTLLVEDGSNTSSVTIISRISTENKKKALDTDGLSTNGKVSGFVETEVVVTTNNFVFSYTQLSANIPLFWEVIDSQILYGRKVRITKDAVHTQAPFDRHFDSLEGKYGVVSILNLIKPKSDTQESLAQLYKQCAEAKGLKITNVEYSSAILSKSPHKLLYLLRQDIFEFGAFAYDINKGIYFGKQTGVLRISAFDSIEKQIMVEKIVSKDILELATNELSDFDVTSSFIDAHDRIWHENSYWLERLFYQNSKNPTKYMKTYSKLFDSKIKLYDPLHFYISRNLRELRSNFTYEKGATFFCGTFNVSGKTATESIDEWIFPPDVQSIADAYIIGLEEVVDLTAGQMLSSDPFVKQYWEKKVLNLINKVSNKRFIRMWSNQLGGVLLMFFMKESEYTNVRHIEGDVKKTGFGGMASNKGAVALSFKYCATSFCIIASHLAAGLENIEQRHNDYKTIFKNIRFSRDLKIKDHDAIIWMGDFNYRILMSNEEVRRLIVSKEYSKLFQKDQLNQQMISGESFPYFHEMPISFPPTYKFDPGTRHYDTSEKMRIPAWTDRILSKGELLKQIKYGCAEGILFSDHRPVYALFEARLTVIDEVKKASLFSQLYDNITQQLADLNEEEKTAFLRDRRLSIHGLDQEALITSPSIRAVAQKRNKKLPPPSSDLKKWWIGGGKQVKVILDVDPVHYMLNPKRNPNPFVEDKEEPLYIPR
ncbi:hypothetical protein KAFR_0K01150 [Kazachstania africana CBS 2517]|uniref:phosphoinositide 5-phosphatase n=1 Tax=Kazachstania africana (strain ATCC 22294 / BCRC 22015 / CBS 2517 / CECT 1963 / NBRC 1671 / NRRL Y-8276) TaxID=1071382 RepID=H2B1H0_KAZAF|nr:hypothetical protein KAFR_0K01150 [Kazachstania africana CBS 2517]CCF60470.1 hypothetical protein KAFR_0K01150 [Kazachstania africana CBS 2517]